MDLPTKEKNVKWLVSLKFSIKIFVPTSDLQVISTLVLIDVIPTTTAVIAIFIFYNAVNIFSDMLLMPQDFAVNMHLLLLERQLLVCGYWMVLFEFRVSDSWILQGIFSGKVLLRWKLCWLIRQWCLFIQMSGFTWMGVSYKSFSICDVCWEVATRVWSNLLIFCNWVPLVFKTSTIASWVSWSLRTLFVRSPMICLYSFCPRSSTRRDCFKTLILCLVDNSVSWIFVSSFLYL